MTFDPLTRRGLIKASAMAGMTIAVPAHSTARLGSAPRRDIPFDFGWKFHLGEAAGAFAGDYDDASWRTLDLPHDWSIEDRPGSKDPADTWEAPAALWNVNGRPKDAKTFGPGLPIIIAQVPPATAGGPPHTAGPFEAEASAGGWTTGFTVGGIGWYRKAFELDDLAAGEQVEIRFDGAYRETEVWLNGTRLGANINGYMGFAFDLTPHLHPGRNVLAVRVANEGDNSRWYAGSGLYRHVWLSRTGAIRIPLWGVAIETRSVEAGGAVLAASVEIENRGPQPTTATCRIEIRSPGGKVVASADTSALIDPGTLAKLSIPLQVKQPMLWNPESPHLYLAAITIVQGETVSDVVIQRFGIRTLSLSTESGFRINDHPHKLRGACVHHDNGLLGAAAIDGAERRKVALLKANSFNAIRCAHNPFSPAFLDACDELGMIVVDEAFDVWEKPKRSDDYHVHFPRHWQADLSAMIRRDRNHPSIAFWSIGNEIPEVTTTRGTELTGQLREHVLEIDRTRFITTAFTMANQGKGGKATRRHLDVAGYNYMFASAVRDHGDDPGKVFMNSESYGKDIHAIWQDVEKYPWLIGDFLWTGMDYLGEVGLGSSRLQQLPKPKERNFLDIFLWDYPAFQSGCGDLDILGRKKPQGFYRDVVWKRSNLEVFVQRPTPEGTFEDVSDWGWHDELPSWSWGGFEGRMLTVRAYTGGDEIVLLLNGKEAARRALAHEDRMKAEFKIAYQPGELVAIARRAGREIGRKVLKTVGAPHAVRLRAENWTAKRDRGSINHVLAEIVDSDGQKVPDASVPLTFRVEGPAKLKAAGSANPYGVESFQDGRCRTFHGEALAIIEAIGRRGDLRVVVDSPGLVNGRIAV